MDNNFWKEKANAYIELNQTASMNILHPKILELVNDFNPSTLLDFGCGDGRLSKLMGNDIQISVYDISEEMLQKATNNLSNHTKVYNDIRNLPKNYFDVIVSSLVFVCISNESEYILAMRTISTSLKENGKVIIGLTHPCFRQYYFSDFFTEFSSGKKFNYLKEGEPFNIKIHNESKTDFISFTDYHWTVSYTVNKMIEVGLKIEKIIELPDNNLSQWGHESKPPFIIFVASK